MKEIPLAQAVSALTALLDAMARGSVSLVGQRKAISANAVEVTPIGGFIAPEEWKQTAPPGAPPPSPARFELVLLGGDSIDFAAPVLRVVGRRMVEGVANSALFIATLHRVIVVSQQYFFGSPNSASRFPKNPEFIVEERDMILQGGSAGLQLLEFHPPLTPQHAIDIQFPFMYVAKGDVHTVYHYAGGKFAPLDLRGIDLAGMTVRISSVNDQVMLIYGKPMSERVLNLRMFKDLSFPAGRVVQFGFPFVIVETGAYELYYFSAQKKFEKFALPEGMLNETSFITSDKNHTNIRTRVGQNWRRVVFRARDLAGKGIAVDWFESIIILREYGGACLLYIGKKNGDKVEYVLAQPQPAVISDQSRLVAMQDIGGRETLWVCTPIAGGAAMTAVKPFKVDEPPSAVAAEEEPFDEQAAAGILAALGASAAAAPAASTTTTTQTFKRLQRVAMDKS